MPEKRSDVHNQHKRKKTRRGGIGRIILIIFLVLLLGIGFFVWKVYSDVTGTTDKIYKNVETEEVRNKPVDIKHDDEPFSVLLLGVDTGDLGRTERGRSDTMMVLTVNPNTNKTTILSIPRDTYTEIVGKGKKDKINHAYAFGGVQMSVNTVQKMLDIPIDYYVEVNMQGLKDIVDALGGVTVTPPLTFKQDQYTFTEGQSVTLDGNAALAYSRMRHEDPQGDYGRQARQRQIISASMKKVASLSSIMNYQSVLKSLESNMTTNLAFGDMVDIFNDYRGAAGNVEQIQMTGSGTKIDGIYYDIVSDKEMNDISNQLREQLEMK
ncbi:LCP family protein [Pisciglobus halotolerans]|uniref:Cell envelope-related function transcriptional attenuator common domain-containing protein n=1 Tax=Pisciglobus halotolerans TaxID=745365 RepID=A0A1I3DJ97_9LACT|nr:LCP family protein [Pisciglobus halotolerans]SFH86810.1 cell envelope-related function transcriptional attenuator common domain-containing protein [Pisciglobus halotolerans]